VCSFAPERRADITVRAGDLVPLKKKPKATMEDKQAWYSQLLTVAQDEGYQPGWAAHAYRDKFGCWPRGMLDMPAPVTPEVRGFLKHRNIRRAKSKEARHARA
jgi:hypothetical protein